ncbi:MAG TPA: Ig-like domain-containing protein, partial [Thermoplasmata archaeon]|nr:Ig-like domain-containing protein [Thermoplasmata archaeon]
MEDSNGGLENFAEPEVRGFLEIRQRIAPEAQRSRRALRPIVRACAIACVLLLTMVLFHSAIARAADPDTDSDGLTDGYEMGTLYTQRATATELPKPIVDGGTETATTTLQPWQGIVNGSFAEFALAHPAKSELTVQVGYWNGTAWVDRYVWDPGRRLVGVSITEPIANQVLAGTVAVRAEVPAEHTIAQVAFFLGTSFLGNASAPSAANTFSISFDANSYPSGAYDLIAVAIDKLGSVASARIPVSIQDAAKPSVSFVAPLSLTSVAGTVRVRVRAVDADGIASVRLRIDSGSYFSILGNFDGYAYGYDWGTASLRQGLHILTAEAKDGAGVKATASVSVAVDNTVPTVSIKSPVQGASLAGAATVTASAADNLGISEVAFTVDDRGIGSDRIPPYEVPWDTRSVSNGTHRVRATAFDGARNTAYHEITVSTANGDGPPGGPAFTVVADLTKPHSQATRAEREQRILPPEFSPALFHSSLTWRIVIRDWVTGSTAGSLTSFALRVEERSDPAKADTDGDTLSDGAEVKTHFTYPTAVDSDGDGSRDDFEVASHSITYSVNGVVTTMTVKTSPTVWDTDGDGLSDGEEYTLGVDRTITNPILSDTDGDSLSDGAELVTYNSNATLTDTDKDTIADNVEVTARTLTLTVNGVVESRSITTLPYAEDSDGDGLRDDQEFAGTSVYRVKTDPSDADTDDDGLMDGQEKYAIEFSIPTRNTVGRSITVPLEATFAGEVERVDVRYGLSTINVSNFRVTLTKGPTTIVLRDRVGTGLYSYSSAEVTTAFGSHGGRYTLEVSSPVTGGLLEEYALSFTLRTSPILSDSDGDGLNDSEETTYGADAWITDPNRVDTDGDTWSDGFEINTKATNPLNVDTDQDGARDDMDLDPHRNLLIAVSVNQIHHGADPWCSPELAGVIRVNGDYTWVTKHETAGLDSFTSYLCPFPDPTTRYSTANFDYTYYSDVPDD